MAKQLMLVNFDMILLNEYKQLMESHGYVVYSCDDERKLQLLLKSEPIELVIVDLQEKSELGIEWLHNIKTSYPLVIRIALSGYSDSKYINRAIQDNTARVYMLKPWDAESLMDVIENLFEIEKLLRLPDLVQAINNLDNLPTVPKIYNTVSALIHEDAPIEKISQLIEQDPALASRILRVANSAYYGSKTGSVLQAIMFIGLINIKAIILSNSVFSHTKFTKEAERIWSHASLTNRYAHQLYEKAHRRKMPMVHSSAGLLHNVGVILMLQHFKHDYDPLLQLFGHISNEEIIKSEQSLFNLNHAQIGGYLLDWWELPHSLVEVAMFYHSPAQAPVINKDIVSIVHIANAMAWYTLTQTEFSQNLLPEHEYLKQMGFALTQQDLLNLIHAQSF